MNNHRQFGDLSDLRTARAPWRVRDIPFILLGLAFVLGVLTFAMDADERDAQKATAYARAEQERIAMPTKVAEAYERGLNDAIEALRATPDGVALAQACMAQGARP